jgi:hypothetical protein
VPSSGLVVLGDSLIELSGMTGYLEQLARANGALATNAMYRDHASARTSFLAENGLNIGTQYAAAIGAAPVTTVIMDGGATDMLQNGCGDAPNAGCPLMVDAVAGARALFGRMAADGVQSVVYFFYADPVNNPGLKARIDVLRPLAQAACEDAPVECHFLDLRPVFEGHYAEYIVGVDGIVFSASGAQAAARAIFDEMKAKCIVH